MVLKLYDRPGEEAVTVAHLRCYRYVPTYKLMKYPAKFGLKYQKVFRKLLSYCQVLNVTFE
jgi:hypothetical protein